MSDLRQAAHQAQAEPVAWAVKCDGAIRELLLTEVAAKLKATNLRELGRGRDFDIRVIPLYASPPQRKPLNADDVFRNNEIMAINAGLGLRIDQLMNLARAIERAHGIGADHE